MATLSLHLRAPSQLSLLWFTRLPGLRLAASPFCVEAQLEMSVPREFPPSSVNRATLNDTEATSARNAFSFRTC